MVLAKILIALYRLKQKKGENFLDEKNAKITKRTHAYKGYASTYSVEILNSFNPELKLKDTESTIKSKLIDLLSELRWFKFVTISVLELKKKIIENNDNV